MNATETKSARGRQKSCSTFVIVSEPTPWTDEQCRTFLRLIEKYGKRQAHGAGNCGKRT